MTSARPCSVGRSSLSLRIIITVQISVQTSLVNGMARCRCDRRCGKFRRRTGGAESLPRDEEDRSFSSPASRTSRSPMLSLRVQWTYDTYAMAHGTRSHREIRRRQLVFITADYAFGYAMERDAGDVADQKAAKCWQRQGAAGTFDFSRYLLQAKTSRAKIVGLAPLTDMINAIKQASESALCRTASALPACSCHFGRAQPRPEGGAGVANDLRLLLDQNANTRAWPSVSLAK